MFFAKEMNYLSTRMSVLARASALIDQLTNIPPCVLNTMDHESIPNQATDFDDMGFEWYIPSREDVIKHSNEKMKNGEGFYDSSVKLDVSQETPRFESLENSLKTSVRIFITLITRAFSKDECLIDKESPYAHDIDITIDVDKNGAHIDEHLSTINVDIDRFKDLLTDEPAVTRNQLESFFNEILRAIDAVNGTDPTEGYLIKYAEKEFNTYGINFDKDGFYRLEDEERFDFDK